MKFGQHLVAFSNGFDVISRDVFRKIWQGKDLDESLIASEAALTLTSLMNFVIILTNPKRIDDKTLLSLEGIKKRLLKLEHPELGVTLPMLRDILTLNHAWFVDRFYELLKVNWEGERFCANDVYFIILHFLGQMYGTKVFFLFTLFDEDESGKLTCHDLKRVLADSIKESGIAFDEDEVNQLVGVMFEKTDNCFITYGDMQKLLDDQEGLGEALAHSLDKWLVPGQVS